MSERWYAVQTKPRSEAAADVGLKRAGLYTFYPFERIKRRRELPSRPGQFKLETVDLPLLPGYLFALGEEGDIGRMNDADGVVSVVHFGGDYLPIPDPIIGDLMARVDTMAEVEDRTRLSFGFKGRPGDRVRLRGAFDGLVAGIVSLLGLDAKGEIDVELQLLGSVRLVSVPVSEVGELIPDRVAAAPSR